MDDYPSNSHKNAVPPVEPKKVEKIVDGAVITRKKPLSKRFTEQFFGGDLRTAKAFILFEILIPAAKDAIADSVSQGFEKMLWGEVRSTSRRPGGFRGAGATNYINYQRFAQPTIGRRDDPRAVLPLPGLSHRSRATHDFNEIILATRIEAETVIERLFDLISKYDSATVADLYDLVGVTSQFTDDQWGWIDIRGAEVIRTRHGYLLNLPKPEPLPK